MRERRGTAGQRHDRKRRCRPRRWAWPWETEHRRMTISHLLYGIAQMAWKSIRRHGLPGVRELCDSGKDDATGKEAP